MNYTILQVVQTTLAGPVLFKSLDIGDGQQHWSCIQSGLLCNNPVQWVLTEAEALFSTQSVSCVISIGSDAPPVIRFHKPTLIQCIFPQKLGGKL